ncbi:hypothetical protein BJX63DRAFT_434145 [Aspergillus granulosus]|uniref:MARVEL domain-containing protein n=1 Tax=Aspergillus granulosus TaxID=176169 RepID=A0ABR4H770_9EURO
MARVQQTADSPPNPIGSSYESGLVFQLFSWIGSIIVFSLAAATVARTPSGAPLYIAAVYNLSVGVVYFVYFFSSMSLAKPASQNTARPSALYVLLNILWLCLWGATGPLMFIYRHQSDEPSRYAKRRLGGLVKTAVTGTASLMNITTACGAFGVICL